MLVAGKRTLHGVRVEPALQRNGFGLLLGRNSAIARSEEYHLARSEEHVFEGVDEVRELRRVDAGAYEDARPEG